MSLYRKHLEYKLQAGCRYVTQGFQGGSSEKFQSRNIVLLVPPETLRMRFLCRQIDRLIGRQIDRQIDKQIDRQIDRQGNRQIDRWIDFKYTQSYFRQNYNMPYYMFNPCSFDFRSSHFLFFDVRCVFARWSIDVRTVRTEP